MRKEGLTRVRSSRWRLHSLGVLLAVLLPVVAQAQDVAGSAPAQKEQLVVLDLEAAGGVEPDVAAAITEAVAEEVARRGYFKVVSASELRTLLGLERQRQLLGCEDSAETSSCLAEVAGALGARFALSGTVAKLGDAFQLTLQTVDSTRATPLGRSVRLGQDLATLRYQLPGAVAEATATPPPPAPKRTLQWSLIGAGGAIAIGSGLVGLDALGRDRELQTELKLGSNGSGGALPGTYADYQSRAGAIDTQKLLAGAGAVVGLGLAAVGVVLLPEMGFVKDRALAVVPSAGGVAVVGVWP